MQHVAESSALPLHLQVIGVEEDVSVYDIADHPDFHFRTTDIVIRIWNSDNAENECDNEVRLTVQVWIFANRENDPPVSVQPETKDESTRLSHFKGLIQNFSTFPSHHPDHLNTFHPVLLFSRVCFARLPIATAPDYRCRFVCWCNPIQNNCPSSRVGASFSAVVGCSAL